MNKGCLDRDLGRGVCPTALLTPFLFHLVLPLRDPDAPQSVWAIGQASSVRGAWSDSWLVHTGLPQAPVAAPPSTSGVSVMGCWEQGPGVGGVPAVAGG